MSERSGSADRVVLPVPERPKKTATSFGLLAETFAEQCIGKTPWRGSRKFRVLNIDFLISPAYVVPPMRIIRRLKFRMMKVPVLVPSISGSAEKLGAETMV